VASRTDTERPADRGVGAPAAARVFGFRFFATPADQPRARRGTDVVLLVPALLGLALAIAAYAPSSLERHRVAEFGLTIGLSSAGLTPEAAISAVLLCRISTYYLPPAWGFPAMLWLQRNRYL
jgi:hypothetical protein